MFEPITGTAPAYWAPYLINGDSEGMSESEIRAADTFAEWLGGRLVSCSESEFFAWNHDARGAALRSGLCDIGGATCLEFTALIEGD